MLQPAKCLVKLPTKTAEEPFFINSPKIEDPMSPQKILDQDPQVANRIATYGSNASELALLSDQRLSELLSKATPLGTSPDPQWICG